VDHGSCRHGDRTSGLRPATDKASAVPCAYATVREPAGVSEPLGDRRCRKLPATTECVAITKKAWFHHPLRQRLGIERALRRFLCTCGRDCTPSLTTSIWNGLRIAQDAPPPMGPIVCVRRHGHRAPSPSRLFSKSPARSSIQAAVSPQPRPQAAKLYEDFRPGVRQLPKLERPHQRRQDCGVSGQPLPCRHGAL
jgi:hypothetical protein